MTLNINAEAGARFNLTASQPSLALTLTMVAECTPSQQITVEPPTNFTLTVGDTAGGISAITSTGTLDVAITASEALGQFIAVTVDGFLCQPNEDSLSRYAGVTRSPIAVGQAGSVVKEGLITNNGWSFTAGQPVYVSTSGQLTQSLTSYPFRRIGYAVSPTQLNLDPFGFLELATAQW